MATARSLASAPDAVLHLVSLAKVGSNETVTCVVDENEAVFTTYIDRVLQNLDVEHPMGQFVVNACRAHREQIGPGAKTLLATTGYFLKTAQQLRNDIPLHVVMNFMRESVDVAVKHLSGIAIPLCLSTKSKLAKENANSNAERCEILSVEMKNFGCDQQERNDNSDALLFKSSECLESTSRQIVTETETHMCSVGSENCTGLTASYLWQSSKNVPDSQVMLSASRSDSQHIEESSHSQPGDWQLGLLPSDIRAQFGLPCSNSFSQIAAATISVGEEDDEIFFISEAVTGVGDNAKEYEDIDWLLEHFAEKDLQELMDVPECERDGEENEDHDPSLDSDVSCQHDHMSKQSEFQVSMPAIKPCSSDTELETSLERMIRLRQNDDHDSDFDDCFEDDSVARSDSTTNINVGKDLSPHQIDTTSQNVCRTSSLALDAETRDCFSILAKASCQEAVAADLPPAVTLKKMQLNAASSPTSQGWASEHSHASETHSSGVQNNHSVAVKVNAQCNPVCPRLLETFTVGESTAEHSDITAQDRDTLMGEECDSGNMSADRDVQTLPSTILHIPPKQEQSSIQSSRTMPTAEVGVTTKGLNLPLGKLGMFMYQPLTAKHKLFGRSRHMKNDDEVDFGYGGNKSTDSSARKLQLCTDSSGFHDAQCHGQKVQMQPTDRDAGHRQTLSTVEGNISGAAADVHERVQVKVLTSGDAVSGRGVTKQPFDTSMMKEQCSVPTGSSKLSLKNLSDEILKVQALITQKKKQVGQTQDTEEFGDSYDSGAADKANQRSHDLNLSCMIQPVVSAKSINLQRLSRYFTEDSTLPDVPESKLRGLQHEETSGWRSAKAQPESVPREENVQTLEHLIAGFSQSADVTRVMLGILSRECNATDPHIISKKLERLNICLVPGVSSSLSSVEEGLVVWCSQAVLESAQASKKPYHRTVLVNGDLTPSFHHIGYKAAVKGKTFQTAQQFLHLPTQQDKWLSQAMTTIDHLNITLVLVRGKVDVRLQEACQGQGIVLMDTVPFQVLKNLSIVTETELAIYISDISDAHVLPNLTLKPFDPAWLDRSSGSCLAVLTTNNPAHSLVTYVQCAPTLALCGQQEEALMRCTRRVATALKDGKVLPGGGQSELSCYCRLQELARETEKAGDTGTSFWSGVKPVVMEAVAQCFLSFHREVLVNSGSDPWKQSTAPLKNLSIPLPLVEQQCSVPVSGNSRFNQGVLESTDLRCLGDGGHLGGGGGVRQGHLSLECSDSGLKDRHIFDNLSSKMAAWRTALDIVNTCLLTDMHVITGISGTDFSMPWQKSFVL